jgi:ABC-type dipeptide/oligopeptide/nickel transport system ATPase component
LKSGKLQSLSGWEEKRSGKQRVMNAMAVASRLDILIADDLLVMNNGIAVMKDGKIIETGMPEAIYRFPKSEYTKNLVAAIPT